MKKLKTHKEDLQIRRRNKKDKLILQRRGILEEEGLKFVVERGNNGPPLMIGDNSENVRTFWRQLQLQRSRKREEILRGRRKTDNLSDACPMKIFIRERPQNVYRIREQIQHRQRQGRLQNINKRRKIGVEAQEQIGGEPRPVCAEEPKSEGPDRLQPKRRDIQTRQKKDRDVLLQSLRKMKYEIMEETASPTEGSSDEAMKRPTSATPYSDTKHLLKMGTMETPSEIPSLVPATPAEASISSWPNIICNLEIHTTIETLIFHREIGEGSFGKVVLASHSESKKLLAVKAQKKALVSKAILVETNVLKLTAQCPFLSHLYAVIQTPEYTFLAMDYHSGGDLYHFMRHRVPFATETTRFFAAEMVCGLQYLHMNGVIHRDIKPGNVLLDKSGHIKITDFGLAVTNVFGDWMETGFVGTNGYIAPEILNGLPYNSSVDWFSFGCILYQMSIGRRPFYSRGSITSYFKSVMLSIPCYPLGMDPDNQDIIAGLLCMTPEHRLGASSDITVHPYFQSIDWLELAGGRVHPPFIMDSQSDLDLNKTIDINKLLCPLENEMSSCFRFMNVPWWIVINFIGIVFLMCIFIILSVAENVDPFTAVELMFDTAYQYIIWLWEEAITHAGNPYDRAKNIQALCDWTLCWHPIHWQNEC